MSAISEIKLAKGDILYRQGDPNTCAYVIESGELLLRRDVAGVRTDIEIRGAGTLVGELSILTNQPRLVTVEAMTDCTLFRLSADSIRNRYNDLDPLLRASIDTSISFIDAFNHRMTHNGLITPRSPKVMCNAEHLIEQFRLETDINKGLESQEFHMLYQPIVDVQDNSIVAFEALMRWVHPTMGFIPPDRFIKVAEATGSIKGLTEFALLETFRALQRLKINGDVASGLFASVNVSGRDIARPEFVTFLEFALEQHQLQPGEVRLEVTETALITDMDIAGDNLARLRALGCGLSIDDFGVGYSNFAYLKSLPITSLKIDRAFTEDAATNAVSHSIVRLLLLLGHDMGVDIIAEGVETKEGLATLQDLGCRYAQGYYFHKPMPESDLAKLLCGPSAAQVVA